MENVPKLFIFSNEARFHLSGNFIYTKYALLETKKFSNLTLKTFAQSKSDCMVYFQRNILVLFEGHDGNTLSIDSGRYVNMLNGFFLPLLNDLGISTSSIYFQFMEKRPNNVRSSYR